MLPTMGDILTVRKSILPELVDDPTEQRWFDHQKGYIDFWLKFIGVKEVHTLVVEGTTWGGKEKGEESIARGKKEAAKLAVDF
jgi:FMN-dependent NADH-azoreductase